MVVFSGFRKLLIFIVLRLFPLKHLAFKKAISSLCFSAEAFCTILVFRPVFLFRLATGDTKEWSGS